MEVNLIVQGVSAVTMAASGSRVGIDLGGTKIEAVLLAADGTVVQRKRVRTPQEGGYDAIVDSVGRLAREFLRRAPEVLSVGIGTPGAVSRRTGCMKNCNTTCLNGRDLPADLARAIARPVQLENDANCFALAEARYGAGQGQAVVFGVILGTGVGGGVVVHGRLLRGPQHIAGEWGHHRIDPHGPACYCGGRGCVERYLSGPALEAAFRQRGNRAAEATEVAALARSGDAVATEVFSEFLDYFGRSVANVINILDPDVVVLGGGLSRIEELYSRGRDAVARYAFSDELRTKIRPPRLGDSAGVIGAALLTEDGVFGSLK